MSQPFRDPKFFPGIESMIYDEIKPGSLILLVGPTGSGKSIFCLQFAFWGLKKGENVLFVNTETPYNEVIEVMSVFDMDVMPYLERNLRFIDCYPYRHTGTHPSVLGVQVNAVFEGC